MNMDRGIFELNASVEATSLYILICALADQGEALTLDRARVQWNGSEEGLLQGAEELIRNGVLEAEQPLHGDTPLRLNPRGKWGERV